MLLNQGQWTYAADTRDLAATAPGLLPFVVHEAKCTQPAQKDLGSRQRAREAHLAASWALIGYFLDPVLFEMLAKSARLQLPDEPSTCRGGARRHCSTLPLKSIMSCGLATWNHLWYGAVCCIPHLQGFRLHGESHSYHSPCPMICRELTEWNLPSGWYVSCSPSI